MISSWGFNFRNIRKALIHSLQLAQKLNGSPRGKSPLLSFAQKCAGDLMQIKTLIKLICYLLASWRGRPDHSLEENCLHRGGKSLKSHGGQPKENSYHLWVFQNAFNRDPVLVTWPKARSEDPYLIFIFCTDQTTLINGPSVMIVLLGSHHKNIYLK